MDLNSQEKNKLCEYFSHYHSMVSPKILPSREKSLEEFLEQNKGVYIPDFVKAMFKTKAQLLEEEGLVVVKEEEQVCLNPYRALYVHEGPKEEIFMECPHVKGDVYDPTENNEMHFITDISDDCFNAFELDLLMSQPPDVYTQDLVSKVEVCKFEDYNEKEDLFLDTVVKQSSCVLDSELSLQDMYQKDDTFFLLRYLDLVETRKISKVNRTLDEIIQCVDSYCRYEIKDLSDRAFLKEVSSVLELVTIINKIVSMSFIDSYNIKLMRKFIFIDFAYDTNASSFFKYILNTGKFPLFRQRPSLQYDGSSFKAILQKGLNLDLLSWYIPGIFTLKGYFLQSLNYKCSNYVVELYNMGGPGFCKQFGGDLAIYAYSLIYRYTAYEYLLIIVGIPLKVLKEYNGDVSGDIEDVLSFDNEQSISKSLIDFKFLDPAKIASMIFSRCNMFGFNDFNNVIYRMNLKCHTIRLHYSINWIGVEGPLFDTFYDILCSESDLNIPKVKIKRLQK